MGLAKKIEQPVTEAKPEAKPLIPETKVTVAPNLPSVRKERDFEAEARGKTYSQQYAATAQGMWAAVGMVLNTENPGEQVEKLVSLVDQVADAQASLVVKRLFYYGEGK